MKKKPITKKQLRTFGLVLALFFGAIGLVHFLKGHTPQNYWFWGVAGLVLLVSLAIPGLIKPIYHVALFLGHILGWINTRLILGLIYFLIFTPIGLMMRLLGKDPLHRKFDKQATSYWNISPRRAIPKEQYLRQF